MLSLPLDISVITVAHNSADCLHRCLESVLRQQGVAFECIVVDNVSTDRTLETARQFGPAVRIVANTENVGFGRANNQGAELSRGQLLLLLNPDAELEGSEALAGLCRTLAQHPRWGLAGTRLLSADGRTESEPSTDYPGQRHLKHPPAGLPGRLAWVGGASLCIRSEVYRQLGGFDPGFFLYSEETDLCLRARKLSHEIGFVSDVTVRHIGGASEAGRDPYEVCRRRLAGLHRFWLKHYEVSDVVRLLRRERRRAEFRVWWYGLLQQLPSARPEWARKRRRELATAQSSARVLKALSTRPLGQPPVQTLDGPDAP